MSPRVEARCVDDVDVIGVEAGLSFLFSDSRAMLFI
jgi:hypothetical protein